ncbi:MAG: glutaminyl-peptide cyclotransferase [Thermoanaerobaculia bacterium]|nr:glutaminyl-peptide cyclotransferase [Thermoanaerobaculia bacterium]
MRLRRRLSQRSLALAGALLLPACGAGAPVARAAQEPPVLRPRIVAVRPHDATTFTQGLLWAAGRLWESSGQYGVSRLLEVDPQSGRIERAVALPRAEFAEGLALAGDRLFQLTWREGLVRVWSFPALEPLATHPLPGEGWGLTWDGRRLIQSDGGAELIFRSPEDLSELGRLTVRRAGRAVPYLNELEWADGAIYANVWMSDEILRIDPVSGEVTAVWDAGGLLSAAERARADVLNGIAWEPERRIFHLTGKYWPWRFEVELPEPAASAP